MIIITDLLIIDYLISVSATLSDLPLVFRQTDTSTPYWEGGGGRESGGVGVGGGGSGESKMAQLIG